MKQQRRSGSQRCGGNHRQVRDDYATPPACQGRNLPPPSAAVRAQPPATTDPVLSTALWAGVIAFAGMAIATATATARNRRRAAARPR
jgi:hypothetical protein